MKIGNKGSAWAFLVVLIAMFVIGLIYIIFTRVLMGVLFPAVETYLDTVTYANGTAVNVSQAVTTIAYLKTVWNWWPFISIIGFIIVAFVMAQRREPGQYTYG